MELGGSSRSSMRRRAGDWNVVLREAGTGESGVWGGRAAKFSGLIVVVVNAAVVTMDSADMAGTTLRASINTRRKL